MSDPAVVLASASPRRAQLLDQIGIRFTVIPADIDESVRPGESPADYVQRMATEKSAAVATPDVVTLSADTVVVKDDRILGKPADQTEAVDMLCALSDSWHEVMTCIVASDGRERQSRLVTTRVCFESISEAQAIDYWRTGEPADKAGGYGIQGIGGIFACKIEGSYSAVVGLPLAETERLLKLFGVDTWRCRIDG
jgi:septum formation protein